MPGRARFVPSSRAGRSRTWTLPTLPSRALATGLLAVVVIGSVPAAALVPPPARAPALVSVFPTPIQHVVLIMLANGSADKVIDQGPFERGLLEDGASASNLVSQCAGLPMVLAGYQAPIFGPGPGSANCGKWPEYTHPGNNVTIANLVAQEGESWYAFIGSMPTPCDRSLNGSWWWYWDSNPFLWSNQIANDTSCPSLDLPYSGQSFAGLVASMGGNLPNYLYITPPWSDNPFTASNAPVGVVPGTISTADSWLDSFLTPVLSGGNTAWLNQTVFFVVYASAQPNPGPKPGNPYFVAFGGPGVRANGFDLNTTNATQYRLDSLFSTTEWLLGLTGSTSNVLWGLFSHGGGPTGKTPIDIKEEFAILAVIIVVAIVLGFRAAARRRRAARRTAAAPSGAPAAPTTPPATGPPVRPP